MFHIKNETEYVFNKILSFSFIRAQLRKQFIVTILNLKIDNKS